MLAHRIGVVALFSLVLALVAVPPASAERRIALVVGIDTYDNLEQRAQLKKARNDAGAIGRSLKALGFEVIHKDELTRSAFNAVWQEFLDKLSPGDTAAFYFAGHGIELGGRNYLLPRDVPNVRPGRDELLKRESLSLQEFLADLREKGTRLSLIILDACRDNPFAQLAGRSVGRLRPCRSASTDIRDLRRRVARSRSYGTARRHFHHVLGWHWRERARQTQ